MILKRKINFGGDSVYLKVIGCILVLMGSSLIGFSYGENLKRRFFQLKEVEQALYQLQSEIVYTHSALPEVFFNVSYKCSKPINKLFLEVSNLLYENKVDSVYEAFKEAFKSNKSFLSLKQFDIDILMDLSKTLGESDIEGQKNIIALTLNNIKTQLDNAEETMRKNIKMYRYLGFSFGAIVVIMIL